MKESEFDKIAEEYRALHAANIRASGEGPEYFAAYKVRDVYDILVRQGVEIGGLKILDFGGGIGTSIPYFRKYFPDAELYCLDVSRKSLTLARENFPNSAYLCAFDGKTIPLKCNCIDLAFAACVFHHIDGYEHVPLMQELRRVLKEHGRLVVFEHNPLNPLTVHAVNTCPFDDNACLIGGGSMKRRLMSAGFSRTDLRYRIFFPRMLASLRPFEKLMTRVPFGAQYYVIAYKTFG